MKKAFLSLLAVVAVVGAVVAGSRKAHGQTVFGPVFVATLVSDAGQVSATQAVQPSSIYDIECSAPFCFKIAASGTLTPNCSTDYIAPPPATTQVIGTQNLYTARVWTGANAVLAVNVADAGVYGSDGGYMTCNLFRDAYNRSLLLQQ